MSTKAKKERKVYKFRRLDNDEIVDVEMTFEEFLTRVDVLREITLPDGAQARLVVEPTQRASRREMTGRPGWPFACDAAAVHPDQLDEVRAIDRAHGLSVDYTSDGRPIFESHEHRRAYLRAHGLYDKLAYY